MHDINSLYKHFFYGQSNEAVSWNSLFPIDVSHPEFQAETVKLISDKLGYQPHSKYYMDEMQDLTMLLHQYRTGQICDIEFDSRTSGVIKHIRNVQMIKEMRLRDFGNEDYETYFRAGKEHKQTARQLLSDVLGFETKSSFSLDAELIIRLSFMEESFLAENNIQFSNFNSICLYAATIALYRYNYLEHGETAANSTPLLGLETRSKQSLSQA
jgi:hypothetical protein